MKTLYMKAVRAVPLLNGVWLEKSGDLHRADALGVDARSGMDQW